MNCNPTPAYLDSDLIQAVLETLTQGETLLQNIDDDAYVSKVPIAFNASIGGHYRHCLDHFRSLLDSAVDGDLNYDHRERGTLIEQDRLAAGSVPALVLAQDERHDPVPVRAEPDR